MASTCPATDVRLLQDLLDGQLSDAQTNGLEEHLLHCDRCARALDALCAQHVLIGPMQAQAIAAPSAEPQWFGDLLERLYTLRPAPAESASTGGFGPYDTPSQTAPLEDLTSLLSSPQGPDEIGRLGPYRVLRVLGAGGMGV